MGKGFRTGQIVIDTYFKFGAVGLLLLWEQYSVLKYDLNGVSSVSEDRREGKGEGYAYSVYSQRKQGAVGSAWPSTYNLLSPY